jgi:hypothetical protein
MPIPEFLEFIGATPNSTATESTPTPNPEQTPDEIIDSAYQELRHTLADLHPSKTLE